ncbi:interferon gamma receptor 1 [Bombina bombina]|uniref:interferon gamma receptor 1 n=1 Tax=Bombina bombina TaxID=8345 RepID=UPI00235AF8C0|nr:interferon gamma receptor 1 [Bombina bombina]
MARHRFPRVIRMVVLVGIIQLFAWAEHPTDLQSQVSAPENLTVHSYNFNTTLYWDYQSTKKTLFQVEFRSYEDGTNWTIFHTCKNIVQSYCDLSTKIDKPGDFYYMRVKALEGSDESDFSKTKEFSLRMEGRIGPPTLDVYMMDKEIVVDIWHAPIPDGLPDIWHFYPDFDYKVHYMKTNQIETNICDDDKCTIFFTPPKKNENYCFSAQGISNLWAVTGEMSKEICLFVEDKDAIADFRLKVAVGTSLGIFLILLIGIVIYIIKKQTLNNSKLPGAL